jgi:hypothetical protein
MVALGLVQLGLFLRDQLVLVEAARAGAREATVDGTDSGVRAAVDRAAAPLDTGRVRMSISRQGGQGDPVRIELSYPDPPAIGLVGWLFPSGVELHAEATMRQEFG